MSKFNFISDEKFRNILLSDYTEIEVSYANKAWKAVVVLAGSVIEALLVDYLVSLESKDAEKQKLLKLDLNQVIKSCEDKKIISSKAANLSDVIRGYRNLIHPGRSMRTESYPNSDDASVAKSLVEIIIKEISSKKRETYGYTAEQILAKIEKDRSSRSIWTHLLTEMNNYEKSKLLLSLLPNRLLEASKDIFYDETEENLYSDFYEEVYKYVDDNDKIKIAAEFCRIVKEENENKVNIHIENFFNSEYLKFLKIEEKHMIIKRLLSQIENSINEKLIHSLSGIGKYFDKKDADQFILPFLRLKYREEHENQFKRYTDFAINEFQKMNKEVRDEIQKKVSLVRNRTSGVRLKRIKDFEDQLIYWDDLPF